MSRRRCAWPCRALSLGWLSGDLTGRLLWGPVPRTPTPCNLGDRQPGLLPGASTRREQAPLMATGRCLVGLRSIFKCT